MKGAHGLAERDLVRIRQKALRLECYVRPDAQSANRFTAYIDADLQQSADLGEFAPGATVELLNSEDWAVVAGINYYPGIRDLQGPVFDCTTFKRWALDTAYVPDRQLICIAASELRPANTFEAHPKVEAITHAFERLIRAADKKQAHHLGRRLYLFFSGHGIIATRSITPDFRETALLAANADSLFLSRHVGLRSWAEWFRALGIFDEVFLVADCCREKEDLVPPIPPAVPDWTPQRTEGRQFYAFATKLAARAWEKELGKPPRVRGVLSWVVAEALKNRKLYDDKGLLTASCLMQHIYNTVPNFSDKQEPIIDYHNNPNFEMIVAKWMPRTKQTVQFKFQPPIPGKIVDIFAGSDSSSQRIEI
jgi:hypothetical protein